VGDADSLGITFAGFPEAGVVLIFFTSTGKPLGNVVRVAVAGEIDDTAEDFPDGELEGTDLLKTGFTR
jgi:hypothetical protein